ncbi:MAG: type II toxin-antitoxin system prevent-host-death family antitoxin [Spirochaetales bacterium]|nr:type II toxin-antitoxin system prevent-host-death family antitoxin [Spirochaetales bacterium]
METIGIFEAKTRFSELCDKVFKSKEPILITKRGVPLVKIDPVAYESNQKSGIWMAREGFIRKYGDLGEDLDLPERGNESIKELFEE